MLGHLQQMRQRLAGDGGYELHHVDPRRHLAALPAAHGLAGDVKLLGKLVLREVVRAPYGDKFFCECMSAPLGGLVSIMSAYAQIDAYPSNGWLRDEKPLCIDSRTWVAGR